MYCIGGITADSASLEYVYRYSVPHQSWLQPVPTPASIVAGRTGHSCTFSRGSLFIFGGLDANKTIASPEFFSFSPTSNTFTFNYANSPTSRLGHVLTTLPSGDLLLLYGTYSSTTPTQQLPAYTFSISTSAWTEYTAVSSSVTPQVLYGVSCSPWSSSLNPIGGVFCFGGETTTLLSNPHLTFLNLSSKEWIDLGVPPAYSSSFTPVNTFGATVNVIDGGNAVVVRAGGAARFDSASTYTIPQNSVICSTVDTNNNSGSFFGILPFGPNTTVDSCYLSSTCPKNTTGLNVPVIVPGWTNPPANGFPIVNASTSATNSGNNSTGNTTVISNDSGNSSGAVAGWKIALGILIPIYLLICLLCCCCWHRKRKSESAAYGRQHNHAFSKVFGHFEMWEIILFALAVLFPLLFILLLCLLWRRRQRRQAATENYRRYAEQSHTPLISKYSEPPSSTLLFETSTGLVPGTYAAPTVAGAPGESSPSSQEQLHNLQTNSGEFRARYDFDSIVDSATGAAIAGAAAAYATLAGNSSGSDSGSLALSTRRTPDGYVSYSPIKLNDGFIATYDSTTPNTTSAPAKPGNLYSIGTGGFKPSSDINYSPVSSNLVDSTASVNVAIESDRVQRKDDLAIDLIAAGAAVTAGAAVVAAETAPKKTRKFKAQFAKKRYSVEPSEIAADLGPQFFEAGTAAAVSANSAAATSTYLPTITETVTTTTTTTQQGFETKTVVQLQPSYISRTDSLSTIGTPTQTLVAQKTSVALDRARRFLYACQSSYGGKFDIRTFEIMALFARPQFEITVMFEFLLEFALTGQDLTAAVISDSFYKANLELPARRQLHLLIALVGANESAVIRIFSDLLACLVEIQSVPIFLGALYPLSPAPSLPDSHILTVMEIFLVRRVSLISETARFDLTSFVAHVRRDNRQMSPPFHISAVLKSIAQSIDPVYTPSSFRATLHACGVDSTSLAVFNRYLVTLCGSVDDATAVLALFARAVRLVGAAMFLRAIGEEQTSADVRSADTALFEEFWERFPSTVDAQNKTPGNAALVRGVRFNN